MSKLWATLGALLGLLSVVMTQSTSIPVTMASTAMPFTTTVPVSPSITPAPSPSPQPEESFFLNTTGVNGTNVVCAHVESTFTFDIKYTDSNEDKRSVKLNLNSTYSPHVDKQRSKCNISMSRIVMYIAFNTSIGSEGKQSFFMVFTNTSKEYSLESFNATFDFSDNKTFPDFNTTDGDVFDFDSSGGTVFTVDKKKSYKCRSGKSYKLEPTEDAPPGLSVSLRTYKFRAQAFQFKDEEGGDFDSYVSCSLDQKSSKVVPIAVGAALAGLVIVVLIAYLIGRFRSRKQNSYEALS